MKIFFSNHFKRQLKKLIKKFPHAKEDLLEKLAYFDLKNEISIGHSIYKFRVKSRDIAKGKSSGFRVYIFVYVKKDSLVPLCMYAKSDQGMMTENELQYHFDKTIEELLSFF